MKKYKTITLILAALMMLTACNKTVSETTVESIATESVSEVTETSSETSYESETTLEEVETIIETTAENVDEDIEQNNYSETIIMYGVRSVVIRSEPTTYADSVGTVEVGTEFEVVGEVGIYYIVNSDNGLVYVLKSGLSTELVEETDETTIDESGNLQEGQPPVSASGNPIPNITVTPTNPNGPRTRTNAHWVQVDTNESWWLVEFSNGDYEAYTDNSETRLICSRTNGVEHLESWYYNPTPTPVPAANRHSQSEWAEIQYISTYTAPDGTTVYGRYVDTSRLDQMVNNYRASLGLPAYTIVDNSIARYRVLQSYNYIDTPGHHDGVANWSGSSNCDEAYNGLYNSPGHRGQWENGMVREGMTEEDAAWQREVNAYNHTMSSAAFDFYEYGGDDVGFVYRFGATVQCID